LPEIEFRKTETMKLHYKVLGKGKPLFILHGLFGLSDNWASLGKIFSERNEVYLIDLRNHGSSPHSDEWTYPALAQDIYELACQAVPDSNIILMGHSLGGKTAMQLTNDHPNVIEKLIVADMAPKEYPGNQFPFIEKLLSLTLSNYPSRKEVEAELNNMIHDWATIQLLLKNIQWNEQEKLEWKFNLNVLAKEQDTIGNTFHLSNAPLVTPALFIRGEKSGYVQDSDKELIKKIFPASQINTLAGAGHWLHADKPKEFADCVNGFIHT
jgi:esterase